MCSQLMQDRLDSFNFDKVIEQAMENTVVGVVDGSIPYVLDSDRIEEGMLKAGQMCGQPENQIQTAIKRYKQVGLVGFQHGTRFAGLFRGNTPQIQIQLEGTRPMALASLGDAT